MPDSVLSATDVTVRRGRRVVLTGIDLEVERGAAVRLAGPNGSGKTSLLRVLAGLAPPARGAVSRACACAFVPEKVQLAGSLRVGEWLTVVRRLRGLPPLDWHVAAERCGLPDGVLANAAARLSKGTLQRVAVLEALESGVPVLLLDEPFAGLDARGREWLTGALAERTVVFTDHYDSGFAPSATLALGDEVAVPPVAVRATHPDGRTLERDVAADASDDLLRTLLDDGWHIDRVGR